MDTTSSSSGSGYRGRGGRGGGSSRGGGYRGGYRGGRGGSRGGRGGGGYGRGAPYSNGGNDVSQDESSYADGDDMSDIPTVGRNVSHPYAAGGGGSSGRRERRGGKGPGGGAAAASAAGGGGGMMRDSAGTAAHGSGTITLPNRDIQSYVLSQKVHTTHLLNLSDLKNNSSLNIHPEVINFNNPVFVRSLFGILKKFGPLVHTLDLSNNGITTLHPLSVISQHMHKVTHLKLNNNYIQSASELDHVKGLPLTTIDMVNNPVQSMGRADLVSEVQRRFPNVETVDEKPIASIALPISIANRKNRVELPEPNTGNFFDTEQTFILTCKFINSYFEKFDNSRDELLHVYNKECYFSYTVGNTQMYGGFEPQESRDDLNAMLPESRNLMRAQMKEQKRRDEVLLSNPFGVMNHFIKSMPKTTHDVANFLVDAQLLQLPPGKQLISITVHGSFVTADKQLKRSFDRVFLLDTPTEDAKSKGWDVCIINDQLHMRPYVELNLAQFTSTPTTAATSPMMQEAAPQTGDVTVSETQAAMLRQLMAATGMNINYAGQCLQTAQWDYQRALQLFGENRASLPPEAFQQ